MISLPKIYPSDVLDEKQLAFVSGKLPYPKAQTGRPPYSNRELLPGILKVLRSGCRWRDLNLPGYPDSTTHWRRLRFWQRAKAFTILWKHLLSLLLGKQKLTLATSAIDGTLIPSFAFQDTTSYSGKHHKTGTKVSLVVEEQGIPLASVLSAGATHDMPLAVPTVLRIPPVISRLIEKMLADKGYDSAGFRVFLEDRGVTSDIPQRELPITWQEKILIPEKIKRRNQKSNNKRFVVERTNAWTKSFRRLRFRFDYTLLSFEAFLNLAFVVICIRKLLS